MDDLELYSKYMEECISIAKRTYGISPPYVGCILLDKNGRKISEGYRRKIEETKLMIHAERDAINQARGEIKGGTIITTLEPCISQKKRSMLKGCSELIIEQGISRVVYGGKDFCDLGGTIPLRGAGIDVVYLEDFSELIQRELFTNPMKEKERVLEKRSYFYNN